MNVTDILADLSRQGVKLWADGDQLRYRAPKGVLTSSLRTVLAERKTEILTLLHKHDSEESNPLPRLVPAPEQRYQPFPLTEIQQAYWVGRSSHIELGNVATHFYLEVERDELDLPRFTTAWQRLIERHDMLRMIVLPQGQQQILEQVPAYQIETLDLRTCGPEQAVAQLEQVRQHLSHQVLPPERWPLFEIRASLLPNRRVRLHMSFDMLIADAWGFQILFEELQQLYEQPDTLLPQLEISFRDYVLAEAQLRNSAVYQRAWEYWQQRLPTLPPAPDLPLAVTPGSLQQPRFVRRAACLEPVEWQRLKQRAAQAGLTASGVLLAAFAEVLGSWSKSQRFTLNLTLFNRLPLHPQVNDLVGDFTSLTLISVDHTVPASFLTRARRLQEQLWERLDQQAVNGIHLLRELARLHGGISQALMPVVFTSTLAQRNPEQQPGRWIRPDTVIYSISQTPQVWLDQQVFEEEGTLSFNWDVVEELFPEGLVDDMFSAYTQLLHWLATEHDHWQESLPCLIPQQHQEQRAAVNATQAPVADGLLHSGFLAQVAQRPEHVAVCTPTRQLTYRELGQRAAALASRLRVLGARPNRLVAIVMHKGWEQVVGALGVLLSGAAYLPLDPDLPAERLHALLAHGEVSLALTQSWLEGELAWPHGVQHLCVDLAPAVDSEAEFSQLAFIQQPEDLAYVIYTSGSTGMPKGVMIEHRAAVNTILDINERFGVSSGDRVLALSSLSFDLSVYDIFGVLAAGGTIVLPAEEDLRNPAAWLRLLLREEVSVWNSVPALMQMLVEYAEVHPEALSAACLRLVLLSGDWIPLSLPGRLKRLAQAAEVISLGGATEASIWSILHVIEGIEPGWVSIPYGRPMVNQRFHVLNEAMEPCPVWVPGQLYIGGSGVARGYWRDEEKTRAGFVVHPRTGERLYRTGDLGRYRPDGSIEFLGREDLQVKVQGYRIELGEIEETLSQHPMVQAAIVTAIGNPHGDKRLVAYVVLQAKQGTSSDGYRASPGLPGAKLLKNYDQEQRETHEQGIGQRSGSVVDAPYQSGGQYDAWQRLELRFGLSSVRKDAGKPAIELARTVSDPGIVQKYKERLSYRQFLQEPIALKQFSNFLECLSQIELEGLPKHRYPSAGGIYPVQTYLYIKADRIEGVAEGIYYYNPQSHCLVELSPGARLDRSIHNAINQPIFDESAFSLFLIGQLAAISSQYGQAARDFCLLEAGYMSQLLMTAAPEFQIGLCPLGGVDFAPIRALFALEESDMLLHSLFGGLVDPSVSSGWSFLPTVSGASSMATESSPTSAVSISAWRDFLRKKLPEYMVPSTIMRLDALPLTPNGKVDRKNLPVPESMFSRQEKIYVAPKSELEQTIAAVWQEVLPVEKVGIHDNFFDLGGNSLTMVRAYNKLHKILDRDISIVEMFFQYPSIHLLAEFLAREQPDSPALEESSDQQEDPIQERKVLIRQQRLVRLKHRTTERTENGQ